MRTTTIGAYPKPEYVPISDWFGPDIAGTGDYTGAYEAELAAARIDAEALFAQAAKEVIEDQIEAGVDIVTDGEIRRENYIHYQCRHMHGIDFQRLGHATMRGSIAARLPTITGPISTAGMPLVHDFEVAQSVSARPVKATVPGPMTIVDTTIDAYYGDERELGADLARTINQQVLALVDAGCRHIQIDEPLMARRPEVALAHGIEHLSMCFDAVPDHVERIVHVCCGYPNALDEPDYPNTDPAAYLALAPALDAAPIDQVSIEDAHRPNDLAALLPRFETTTVALGVVAIARSRLETVDQIAARLDEARRHLPEERLLAAPDCGLGFLGRELAIAKLANLCRAATR